MQGRTRAKKSNKNARPAPQVDFTLLTKEQKADASSRKELDVFIANPVPEPGKKERLSSAFLTVDPDAFGHPRPLTREMKDVVAERRQRIPTEADAEWLSRRKMRGETPAQKAYRAAMALPGADEQLKKVQAPPRPVPRQTATPSMQTKQLPPLRGEAQTRQTQPKVITPTPRVITPEPPRPAATVEPAPKETPLLPEESPLSEAVSGAPGITPAAETPVLHAAPTEKTSDILARSIQTTPAALQTAVLTENTPEEVPLQPPKPSAAPSGTKTQRQKNRKKKKRAQDDHTVITDLQTEIPVREGRSTTRPEAYREEREKRRKKEERLTYIIVACVALFLVAGFFLIRIYMNYRRSADEYAELSETYVTMSEASAAEAETDAAGSEDYPRLAIDFNSLASLNEDLVGWIYVPGCGISYPIVRGEDNDYYLNHTFLKTDSSSGAIFMDYQDAAGFIDFNTFIYGHNLKDGTMFTALGNYRTDPDLIAEEPYFYIYRSNGSVRKYRICAFYNDEGYSDSYFRVTAPEDKEAYIAMINTKSVMTQGLPLAEGEHAVSAQDLLVTLSTCQDSVRSGRRFIVHGYLVASYLENKR